MQFAFFDDSPDWLVLFNWASVMGLFVFVSYWFGRLAHVLANRAKVSS